MTTAFLSDDAWPTLTKAIRKSRAPVDVAVAYFGDKCAAVLNCPPQSRLVVDASELSVKNGRTCPAELAKLVKRGVRVFSVPELHAKVFVVGPRAFIGSNNVSRHSQRELIEAVVATDDIRAIAAARRFVRSLCYDELGPSELKLLQKLYRKPSFETLRGHHPRASSRITLPRVCIAHLDYEEPSAESMKSLRDGRSTARKLMERPRGHELDEFQWWGPLLRPKDIVAPAVEEPSGRVMMEPPGKILHVRRWRNSRGRWASWVFIERVPARRIEIGRLAARLGRGAKKHLSRNGRLKAAVAQRLLAAWKR